MTTQQAERHQVKVVGMGQTTGGNDFLVVEPWFKTQYPLNIYLKEGTGGNIRKGDIITVEKGSQQKNKQGQLKDPKFESSFYWNLVEPDLFTQPQSQAAGASPASQTNAPQQTSRTASSPATTTQGSVAQGAPLAPAPVQENQYRTPSQNMRTDSVKFAMELLEKGINVEDLINMSEIIEKFIATGTAPATKGEE